MSNRMRKRTAEEKSLCKKLTIYVDGGLDETCYVVEGEKPVTLPLLNYVTQVTGNVAEYYAIIRALQYAITRRATDVTIISDSEVAIRQLSTNSVGKTRYKTRARHLKHLNNLVRSMLAGFNSVEFKHVPREENPAGVELERRKKGYVKKGTVIVSS